MKKAFIVGLICGVLVVLVLAGATNVLLLNKARDITISRFNLPLSKEGQPVSVIHVNWVCSLRKKNVVVADVGEKNFASEKKLSYAEAVHMLSARYPKGVEQINAITSLIQAGAFEVRDAHGKFIGILNMDKTKIVLPAAGGE